MEGSDDRRKNWKVGALRPLKNWDVGALRPFKNWKVGALRPSSFWEVGASDLSVFERSERPTFQFLRGQPLLAPSWLGYRSGRPLSFWKVGRSDLSVFGRSDAPTSQKLWHTSHASHLFYQNLNLWCIYSFFKTRLLPHIFCGAPMVGSRCSIENWDAYEPMWPPCFLCSPPKWDSTATLMVLLNASHMPGSDSIAIETEQVCLRCWPWWAVFINRTFAGATLFNNTDYTKYPKYLFWVVVFHFLIILPVNCYN